MNLKELLKQREMIEQKQAIKQETTIQEIKPETIKPINQNRNFNGITLERFLKNEFALYGFMQLIIDKGILSSEDIERYTVEGILNGKTETNKKPLSKLEQLKQSARKG